MSLLDAVKAAGVLPGQHVSRAEKKRFSELLSAYLAQEVAEGLRGVGFPGVKPARGGPGEREFQGGLGPKKVDVSYSDARHGLLLAVSIKSINFPPFGKNLKNRFGDLCTEAITLHMRFPYSVVGALFAFPASCNADITPMRPISTFERARRLLRTISGRKEYTDPGEKFEDVTLMLFQPVTAGRRKPGFQLFQAVSGGELGEADYYQMLRHLYNERNPHATIEQMLEEEG